MKIAIAGGSGFVGSHLASYFEKQGHELILLSRNPTHPHMHYWNPEANQMESSILENVEVVINLSGETVFGRWSGKKMERIKSSRLISTHFLCNALLNLKRLPKLYIGASATGYYGDRENEILVESSTPGKDFLSEVCTAWEKIPDSLTHKKVRVILARFGIVLGSEGGALKYIEKAFNTGMGGVLGSGGQMMSWIAIDDLCGAMEHVILHDELVGPVNFVSPQAVTNMQFTHLIGKLLHRPTVVSVPKFALNMLFGEGAQVFLSSTHAQPKCLLESGYIFQVPELEGALKKYLKK